MGSSSLKTINTNHKWSYDVFVSFGGGDSIKRFADHLFSEFKCKGIRAFREADHVHRGKERFPQVYRAIEQSRFLVVIFSEGFASTPSCLRELVKILECKEKEHGKYEFCPIFYNIKPEMVVNQTETYEAKEALIKATNLPGWDLERLANGYESKFIDMIIEHIFNELNVGSLHVGEKLVGVHSRAKEMNLLQFVGSSEVHMIGICGASGIGKTSIAKAVYNQLYAHFEVCSFCEDVKEFLKKHRMVQLQRQIIRDIMKEDMEISNVGEGSNVMKQIMVSKKVLLILDDVDQLDHLEALAASHCWFGPGSLVVITGENRQLLIAHGVEKVYDVKLLHDDEAMELFSMYAFNTKQPKEDFKALSDQVVRYMQGHPLALKVLGFFLFGKNLCEWESELRRLELYPTGDIQVLISRFSLNDKKRKNS